jgi:hypothetical protein
MTAGISDRYGGIMGLPIVHTACGGAGAGVSAGVGGAAVGDSTVTTSLAAAVGSGVDVAGSVAAGEGVHAISSNTVTTALHRKHLLMDAAPFHGWLSPIAYKKPSRIAT